MKIVIDQNESKKVVEEAKQRGRTQMLFNSPSSIRDAEYDRIKRIVEGA